MRKLSFIFFIFLISMSAALATEFAAKVNGEIIHLSRFERAVELALLEVTTEAISISTLEAEESIISEEAEAEEKIEMEVKRSILDKLIESVLIEQGASREGIVITEEEIDTGISEMKEKFPSPYEFHKTIAMTGMTVKDLKMNIRKQLLIQKLKEIIVRDVLVTDGEIQKFYDRNKDIFIKKERVRIKHIRVDTYDEAVEVIGRLEKGQDFDELAGFLSSASPDEEIGWDLGFVEKGELSEELDEIAFWLKPGEVSPIIELEDGYHIIKVVGKIKEKVTELEDARESIKEFLMNEKASSVFKKWLEEEKAIADIEINEKLEYLYGD